MAVVSRFPGMGKILSPMMYLAEVDFGKLCRVVARTSILNPKLEIRNPKQYRNKKAQNSKQINTPFSVFKFWSLSFRSLEFVSNFEFRVSDLPDSANTNA